MGRGCKFCNCESTPETAACEGCFKLHASDWLASMPQMLDNDIFEVRFKNTRRGYYKNVNGLELKQGDVVTVESSPGHDVGIVSLTGDMVARQMKRVGFTPLNGEFKKIYRKSKPYDIEKWQEAIALEHETMIRSRQIAAEMGLNMKIGDVEYQGDKIKAIFYYIADERVDFRELIKVFADQFRIRIEMKQIGARQEAGRIGGLGSCGRELCCSSWISSFVSVTTNSARTQEISLNPQKLAGQCSKLKCCLIYELDTYIDARKEFPQVSHPLQALDGEYHLVKTDILGRTMSFSTSPNAMIGVVTLPIARVREILDINRKGKKVDKLQGEGVKEVRAEEPGFVNAIGEESITRFDSHKEKRDRNKRFRKPGDRKNGEGNGNNHNEKAGGNGGRNGGGRNGNPQRENRNGEGTPREKKNGNGTPPRQGDQGGNPNPQRQGGQNGQGGQGGQGGNRNRNRNRHNNKPKGEGTPNPQGPDRSRDK